jgi:hypothetical protein
MSEDRFILGLSGFARVGKDTVRAHLERVHGFQGLAFADKVREWALHLNPYFPELQESYSSLLQRLGYDLAKREHKQVRDYLIKIGHGARKIFHGDIWVDALLHPDKLISLGDRCLVISDVRYPNEATRIRELGGFVIRITRPGVVAVDPTEAESLAQTGHDYEINNDGSVEALGAAVDRILAEIRKKKGETNGSSAEHLC